MDNSHVLEEKDEDNDSDGCMDVGSKEGSISGQMEDEEDEEEHVRILFMEVSWFCLDALTVALVHIVDFTHYCILYIAIL